MLTFKEQRLLIFIRNYIKKTGGVAPTLEEMSKHMGTKSLSSMHTYVCRMEKKGFIRRLYGRPRALEVLKSPAGGAEDAPRECLARLREQRETLRKLVAVAWDRNVEVKHALIPMGTLRDFMALLDLSLERYKF